MSSTTAAPLSNTTERSSDAPNHRRADADQKATASIFRPSVFALGFIEILVGTLALSAGLLVLFYPNLFLRAEVSLAIRTVGCGLACLGLGLFLGVLTIRRFADKVSPIITYTPAFLLSCIGYYFLLGLSVEATDYVREGASTYSNVAIQWVYPLLLIIGLGCGLIWGRINHDLRAIFGAEKHESFLFCKSIFIALALVGLTFLFSDYYINEYRWMDVLAWAPLTMLLSALVIFLLSWGIDIAMYGHREIQDIQEFPGPVHRFGYWTIRACLKPVVKLYFRYQAIDARNVPETGGVVLAANHGSFLDPILLACGTDRMVRFIIYAKYYRSFAHPLFRFLRCIPLDEKDQLHALRTSVRSLRLGACLGIFPEGEVSKDGNLHAPLRGALFLAQRASASVVPVALKGDYQAMPRDAWFPRPAKVTAIFGKPFLVDPKLSKDETEKLSAQMMTDLAVKLGVPPPPPAPAIPAPSDAAHAEPQPNYS